RLDPDVRVELRRRVSDGQADAGDRRAPDAREPAGGKGPGHQRRRLHLRRREPGGPAVPRVEAERSVRQGEPADGTLQVQPGLSVYGDDDEARTMGVHAEVGEGA